MASGMTMGVGAKKSSKIITQFDLVTGIMKLIAKHGPKALHAHQMNAVIDAANSILAELQRPFRHATPGMGLDAWCKSDDRGRSSDFLMRVTMTGMGEKDGPYPCDPDDLGRCIRFLEAVPEAKQNLDRMKTRGPYWIALMDAWDELVSLYKAEAPTSKAPKCYERMQAIISGVRAVFGEKS